MFSMILMIMYILLIIIFVNTVNLSDAIGIRADSKAKEFASSKVTSLGINGTEHWALE